ncbi:DUF1015 family protein [Rhodoplanes sp. TEM]|uniref:DUF1015 family protein n=1 Tax=Rhodoplanes tepidamans TaxID=200616 RepID=A0ABT5J5G9_RHOTP|nr:MULTISPECIES: DUF1015 family protein [Rhodoplanes]MDC7784641.1 DUF1015 family protein [Rhodoplanes tepidamans]MDC7982108.1 DUF1015 family protein [Rhodoplanes sp. TEM]MDQ0356109.1 uncharacterized protein (DUF1015 family) [Rhodoplanes tepidamans]
MPLVQPFRALRPAPGRAAEVLAPPYDVLSSDEARARAAGKPWSFLHISKPEIDLDPGIDPYAPAVYAKARENLDRMVADGVLIRDDVPSYYAYRLTWRDRVQTGLAVAASVADYDTNRIRKHELTTPAKEDDRVRQIEAVNAQTGPVMLAYRDAPGLDALLAQVTGTERAVDVTADDGVRHEMWVVDGPETVSQLTRMIDALPNLYIADGHHRSAAASRVAAARGGPGSHSQFLAVMFPDRQMTILDYNRLMKDLNGHTPASLLAALGERFEVTLADGPVRPAAANAFGLFVDGAWYALALHPELVPTDDPVGRLPITLLTKNAIEPLFGITDQRRDKRIDFVGGGRGVEELARRVLAGDAAAAFSLYPTQMVDLMAVADAGEIMPPKSTWFEPKLADGMVSHVLD